MTFEVTAGGRISQFQEPLSQNMQETQAPLTFSSCASKLPAPAMALTLFPLAYAGEIMTKTKE